MPSSNRARIVQALAKSRELKLRDERLTEEYQRLRREFEALEEQKNALKARRSSATTRPRGCLTAAG